MAGMIWKMISAMPVVSNTSPISNLAAIGRLDLLREQLGEIFIPPAVKKELDRHPSSSARSRVETAISDGWLRVTPLASHVPHVLVAALDAGEAEALMLATQLKASLVLLDETPARIRAQELGIPHTGILGVLRHAKRGGRIPSLALEIDRLKNEARFFVSADLERRLLASVGEV